MDLISTVRAGANPPIMDLRYANLTGADLIGAAWPGADLRYADPAGAYMYRTNLRYADVIGADLQHVNLTGTLAGD